MTFNILTWNIKSGHLRDQNVRKKVGTKNLNKIAEVIKDKNISAVSLQEVDVHTKRASGVHQVEYLAKRLKNLTGTTWHYAFIASLKIFSGYYGNAILSAYPLEIALKLHMPKINDKEHRSFLLTKIHLSYTEHLYLGTFHLGFKDKEIQAQLIKKTLFENKYLDQKLIIGGDLNAPIDSKAYEIILKNTFPLLDIGPLEGCTFQCYNNFKNPKIDFFFVNSKLKYLKGKILEVDISDHRPLLTKIKI